MRTLWRMGNWAVHLLRTMSITFALAVPHTPWIPDRVASFERLMASLIFRPPFFRVFSDREPNWSWAQKLWRWGLESGASHLVQLQDDVIAGPGFWTDLRAMVEAVPDDPIGLESVLNLGSPWYTTGDGLIGVGYVLPMSFLRDLFAWQETALRSSAIQSLNEDQLLGVFTFANDIKIWHPNPTIIDHDVDLESTYGNDKHSHRRPARSTVRGELAPASWAVPEFVPHKPRFYEATPAICRRWVKGYSWTRYQEDCRG